MNKYEENLMLGAFLGFTKETAWMMPSSWRDRPFMFDTDWNYLMKVVIKINTFCDFRFTVSIQSMDVVIHDNVNGGKVVDYFSDGSTDELIVSVFNACVEFVKWYNQQK